MDKKAKILVSVNNKGGVGKSFIVQLLASYFAGVEKLNVLAIDFDRQGNLSTRFLNDSKSKSEGHYRPPRHPEYDPNDVEDSWDGYSSSAHIFFREEGMEMVAYPTGLENLKILPADSRLMSTVENNRDKLEMTMDEALEVISDVFNPTSLAEWGYDLVIIDTPPNLGIITMGAIRAATHAVIPFEYNAKSIQGFGSMISAIDEQNAMKAQNRQTINLGLLANKVSYNKRSTQNAAKQNIKDDEVWSKCLIPCEIRDTVDAEKVDTVGLDIMMPYTTLSKDKHLRIDAEAFCSYVGNKMGMMGDK